MTRRLGLMLSVAGVLYASILLADPSVVKTTDGTTYRGEVTERAADVLITNHRVETVIPRADVASIQPIGDYEKNFQARLVKLDQKDTPGRIALAREAFDQARYDLARDTLELALTFDPGNRDAIEMLDLVQSQIRMERARHSATSGPATRQSPTPIPMTLSRRLLTNADIEAIRREELRATDTAVRIRFVSDVKRRYAESQNMSLPDFSELPPVEQALEIFRNGDASMRDQVHVLSDPESLIEFRRQVQPLVLQGCATMACHGGPAGGRLMLLTAVENDSVTYSNFYILMTFSRKVPGGEGVFGGSERHLIERGRGEQSVLVNYGLPSTVADYDHPPINGKPLPAVFRNRLDARYRMLVNWMDESLNPATPNYGIHFTPPGPPAPLRPTSQPAKEES